MSDKCLKISNQIYKKHREIYKLDKVLKLLCCITIISFLLTICNVYLGNNSIYLNILFTLIILGCYFLVYLRSKKYKAKVNNYSKVYEVTKILKANEIHKFEHIVLLKEELTKETEEVKNDIKTQKNRITKLFFYIFWIPSGFLCAYFFNSTGDVLELNQLKQLSASLLVIAIQLISIISILSTVETDVMGLVDSRRKKYELTIDYINEYIYGSKSI